MTTDYTPTTDEVRNSYIEISFRAKSIREEQFDHWLQKVKEEAFDLGYDLGYEQGYDACLETS